MKTLVVLFMAFSVLASLPTVSLAEGEDSVFLTLTSKSYGKRNEETCSISQKSVSVRRVIGEIEVETTKPLKMKIDVARLLGQVAAAKAKKTSSYAYRMGGSSYKAVAQDGTTIVLLSNEAGADLKNESDAADSLTKLADALCK